MAKHTSEPDIREFFRSIEGIRHEISLLQESEKTILAKLLPGGLKYDTDRIQSSPSNKTEEAGWKVLEIRQKIRDRRDALASKLQLAIDVINAMPTGRYRSVLWMKYINGQSWKKIASLKSYDPVYLRGELHSKALEEAAAVYKDLTKPYIHL